MKPFTFQTHPHRVRFGSGIRNTLPQEMERLGIRSPLLVTSLRQLQANPELATLVQPVVKVSGVLHTPLETTENALKILQDLGADGLVAVGGGSHIGLSKALALRTGLPQIVLPTTYSGSEMTDILGETRDGVKTTLRNPQVLPETMLYDVDLTLHFPVKQAAVSGINALAHAAEALYARDQNPVTSLLAREALKNLHSALLQLPEQPFDLEVRSKLLYGAFLAGHALNTVSMAMQHKLAHVVGGTFNLPHAETHAVLLPYTLQYNQQAAPEAFAEMGAALNTPDVPGTLHGLNRTLGVPTSLQALGMPESGIEQALELALKQPYWNPRPLEREALSGLLWKAWRGERAT